jgi:hypothetical protein
MTYCELESLIRGKTNKTKRKIAGNTWGEIDSEGAICITFHKTVIIRAYPNGMFFVTNGGYQTVTTKLRLNQFTPFQFWQSKKIWFTRENGYDIEFWNGMILVA